MGVGHAGKLAGEPKEGQLASRLERGGAPQDGFAAVARLAWSLLLAQYGSATTRGRARQQRPLLTAR